MIAPPRVLTLKATINVTTGIALPMKRGATIQMLVREPRSPVPMTYPNPAM